MKLSRTEWNVLYRRDFASFIQRSFLELNPEADFSMNWHIELVAEALVDCMMGRTTRLIINVPPRSLKSHCASVAFVAWLLGHKPSSQLICASYAQDLSEKHARDTQTLMKSRFYQDLFPTRLSSLKQAVSEFMTTDGGVRLSTSVGGTLTGRGGDFIIIDDPLKPDEALSEVQRKSVNDWFDNTLLSRLNNKRTGCIILIMQRLHEDDLVGHVQEHGEWKILRFPAIAEADEEYLIPRRIGGSYVHRRKIGDALHPEREPIETLEALKRGLGEYNFAGQYQQSPAPLDGGMVKAAWFKTYTDLTLPPKFDMIFQSWDTANKATELCDYSVCTTWGCLDKKLYLLHVLRKRLEYPDLKRNVLAQAEFYSPRSVLIEDKASGTQLIQELRAAWMHSVTEYKPTLDKIMRLHSVTATIENGFVYLPEKAEWLATYLHELTTFPGAKYDDQTDSTSQALDWVKLGQPLLGVALWLKMEEAKLQLNPDRFRPRYAALAGRQF